MKKLTQISTRKAPRRTILNIIFLIGFVKVLKIVLPGIKNTVKLAMRMQESSVG
jgi:hypothetical protein